MRLPVPGPRQVVDQVEALLGAVPRVFALLERTEELVARIDGVATDAGALVGKTGQVVDGAAEHVTRLSHLLDGLEPSLTRLQPTLDRLAETTDPQEVEALVRLVNHLPQISEQVERDVLPVLGTLGSVAPDLHDLLEVSRELNDMLAKVPGLGRIKKRIDEQQGEDDTDAAVRD
ncbi:hypothetical protein EKO23_17710 [Nocardioides guangzhouensis]|uniref:MCE family protein n=1 Tax=Nocardioides guangzhouensis TaxID=2497878 RepID=A0A4Q4ZA08_9ACTN|nr:hypothetical protein [Nocardioides guangzhouensis]RYP83914.1 hypothetical protein EKO23_17710 [Nocardioides guangzhouensis]